MDEKELYTTAARVGAEAAMKSFAAEQQKWREQFKNRRLRNIKLLLRNYREISLHATGAIASLQDLDKEDYNFFKSLMEGGEDISVHAIVRSKAVSHILLAQLNAAIASLGMLYTKPEEQRRYRELQALYLSPEALSPWEIAEKENVDVRTVYRDIEAASERLAILLFGIAFMELKE